MALIKRILSKDPLLVITIVLLLTVSILVLRSIAPGVFPAYYLYFIISLIFLVIFSQIDIDVLSLFHKQLYILSIIFLIIPLIIGQVTRGTIRWIPIGPITIQPSEIVRPFLLLFFANYLNAQAVTIKRLSLALLLLVIPLFLIVIQPSLGVTALTAIGFLGVLVASSFSKKMLFVFFLLGIISSPLVWFGMADYQRGRILDFLTPTRDPSGSGYNSLQAMITVGSGKLWGRGLGEGVQTQLAFLPERHTDFIFASVAEEMGFVGAAFLLALSFFLLYRIVQTIYKAKSMPARCFITGIFFTLFAQTMIHIGMNMGIFPITGIPLPLVSAGGSSLLATMTALGMILASTK